MSSVRVVVADDTLLVRQGVVALLTAAEGVEVAAECQDLDSLYAAVEANDPDVVLTDICMPPTMTDEGVRAARHLRAERPQTGVILLSQYAEPDLVLAVFEEGSDRLGYLLKDRLGSPDELARAVRSVADGGSVVDPHIVDVLVRSRTGGSSAADRLTPREQEVMALIAEGWNNSAIAERLVVSEKAVAKHINSIFTKLDLGEETEAHRRVKAVLAWLAR